MSAYRLLTDIINNASLGLEKMPFNISYFPVQEKKRPTETLPCFIPSYHARNNMTIENHQSVRIPSRVTKNKACYRLEFRCSAC